MKMFNAIFGGMLLCAHLSFAQAYETDLFALLDNADKSVDQIDSVVDAAYEEEVIDSVQVEEEVAQEGAANLIEEEILILNHRILLLELAPMSRVIMRKLKQYLRLF